MAAHRDSELLALRRMKGLLLSLAEALRRARSDQAMRPKHMQQRKKLRTDVDAMAPRASLASIGDALGLLDHRVDKMDLICHSTRQRQWR